MTKREFLNAVVALNVEEVSDYAVAELEKMDAANEKRKNTPSKKALENAPLVDKIVNEILSEEVLTATDIAAAMEISVQKASALCRKAVAEGRATSQDIKVKGKGTVKGYILA